MENKSGTRVLIVDDEVYTQEFLKVSLEDAGFECHSTGDREAALLEMSHAPFEVVFAGVTVGGSSAAEFVKEVKKRSPETMIVVVASPDEADATVEVIRAGAYDHLSKPINIELARLAASRAAERRKLEVGARDYQKYLRQVADERAAETRRLFYSMTRVLVRLFELKSPYKSGHPLRVAEMARYVAHEMKLTEDGVRKVYLAGLLADVGMIAVHEGILMKAEALTEEEHKRVRVHISAAEEVLRPILEDAEVLKYIRHHHERFDGSGYPDGLRGKMIPLGSRIIAVVEAFVAMTQDRPYRKPLKPEGALDELHRCTESQFDPTVVAVFADLHDRVFRSFDKNQWVLP
jgi:putative two-component system response regulator